MSQAATVADVLTLDEAAGYLRLPVAVVERQASLGRLPAREIDGHWRFLRVALEKWLSGADGKSSLIEQAGILKDDESLPQMLADIYAARGRSETEPDVDRCALRFERGGRV